MEQEQELAGKQGQEQELGRVCQIPQSLQQEAAAGESAVAQGIGKARWGEDPPVDPCWAAVLTPAACRAERTQDLYAATSV